MTKEELNNLANQKDPYETIADRGNIGIAAYVAWRQGFEMGFKECISIIKNIKSLDSDINKFIDENFWELV